jgi:hypothetical protein
MTVTIQEIVRLKKFYNLDIKYVNNELAFAILSEVQIIKCMINIKNHDNVTELLLP